ncbi:PspC domain-containing protein [Aeromicrobium fastidiosum]|uniref:PspC domain-containing protein n=1 Tax=Aeromicrobium fastidiosum TaxID=52699 RepID=A0A641AIV1_9ACTN|nr:PspC domain-containing protein [Aeromicrobium fastidiosum]KAA1374628.1 PspC domain-containing protein [Aeromicrobium fastidiosum]MBP2390826.1 phage shock protein PspC (stress-responsive transcriptional regulator) [Aeromicrobium fastidiosum]
MTKQLTRTPDDKWIAGVCGGVADHFGIDATIVRIVLVVCTLLGAGSLVVGYLVAWALMPKRDRQQPVWTTPTASPATAAAPAPQ